MSKYEEHVKQAKILPNQTYGLTYAILALAEAIKSISTSDSRSKEGDR